jgi:pimeloyl-ACP methyl ester carboxylesterase
VTERTARAIFRACSIPGAPEPHDRATLKIFYPALPDDGQEQRNAGLMPADRSAGPCPVVVIMPGINVGPEAYTWLASDLAHAGFIAVTYTFVAEDMPGYVSLTPGLDLSAIKPETYGTRPSGNVIAPLIDALARENSTGPLEGCVDIGRIILAGHSGGGSAALYNANPDWFPGVRGAFAYGAHAGASTALGFEDNTILPLPATVPMLLAAGTRDGVIASSAHRYGGKGDRVQETFERGFGRDEGDSYLVEVAGGNHFSIAWPVDESTGRHFLDEPEEGDPRAIREFLSQLLMAFIKDTLGEGTARVGGLRDHPLAATFRCR